MIKIICVVLLFAFTCDALFGLGSNFNSNSLLFELIDTEKADDNNEESFDNDTFINQEFEKQYLPFKNIIQVNSHSFLLLLIRNIFQCVRAPPA